MKPSFSKLLKPMVAASLLGFASQSVATIVEFQIAYGTVQDTVEVNLYDESTPATVENFLKYVNQNSYSNTMIHRALSGFVIQGGGFDNDGTYTPSGVNTFPAVINEPVWSNVQGTIAMAKVGGNKNSATSQWFFNLANNSTGDGINGLDVQNGGFTVFGQVTKGMDVISDIAGLTKCDFDPSVKLDAFDSVPVTTCEESAEHFVTVTQVTVIDDDPASANTLTPIENTLIKETPTTPIGNDTVSSGSVGWLALAGLGFLLRRRKLEK